MKTRIVVALLLSSSHFVLPPSQAQDKPLTLKEIKERAIAQKKTEEQKHKIERLNREAREFFAQRQWYQAISRYEIILEMDPQNNEANKKIAQATKHITDEEEQNKLSQAGEAFNLGKLDESLAICNLILQQDPGNSEAMALIGKIRIANITKLAQKAYAQGQWNHAISLCKNLLEIDPQNIEAKELIVQAKKRIITEEDVKK